MPASFQSLHWKSSFVKGVTANLGTTELQWLAIGRSAANAGMENCPQLYIGWQTSRWGTHPAVAHPECKSVHSNTRLAFIILISLNYSAVLHTMFCLGWLINLLYIITTTDMEMHQVHSWLITLGACCSACSLLLIEVSYFKAIILVCCRWRRTWCGHLLASCGV